MPMGRSDHTNVGVLVERASGERRVALIPADIKKLTSKVTFVIESGAGREAGFEDNAYLDAGARIAELREILESSDVVIKVRPPILKVDEAKSVLVLKRGKGRGFSGVENDLFVGPKTSMLFGDARQSLLDLGLQVKEA